MKRKDQAPDLFAWADARPKAEVVDFLGVRPTMPRWILARRSDVEVAALRFDRRLGIVDPAPILPLKREA